VRSVPIPSRQFFRLWPRSGSSIDSGLPASSTFAGSDVVTMCSLLRVPFLSGSRERTPKGVFCSEDYPNVVTIPDKLKLLGNSLHLPYKHRTKRFYLIFWATSSHGAVKSYVDESGCTH
jgi:hypothetical protein